MEKQPQYERKSLQSVNQTRDEYPEYIKSLKNSTAKEHIITLINE
jgi:hypothetical protein